MTRIILVLKMAKSSKSGTGSKLIYAIAISLLLAFIVGLLVVRSNDNPAPASDKADNVPADKVLPFEDNVDRIMVKPSGDAYIGTLFGPGFLKDSQGHDYYSARGVWIDGPALYSNPENNLSNWGSAIYRVTDLNRFIAAGFDNSNGDHPCSRIPVGKWTDGYLFGSGDSANILGAQLELDELAREIKDSQTKVICLRVKITGSDPGSYVYRAYHPGGNKEETNRIFYNPALYEPAISLPIQTSYKANDYRQFSPEVTAKLEASPSTEVPDEARQAGLGEPDLGFRLFVREHYSGDDAVQYFTTRTEANNLSAVFDPLINAAVDSDSYSWEFAKLKFDDFEQAIINFDGTGRQAISDDGLHLCQTMNLDYLPAEAYGLAADKETNVSALPTVGRDEVLCIKLSSFVGQSFPLSRFDTYLFYYPLFGSDA